MIIMMQIIKCRDSVDKTFCISTGSSGRRDKNEGKEAEDGQLYNNNNNKIFVHKVVCVCVCVRERCRHQVKLAT